jgi:DNA repair exonuclease SbcCD nuclease subunit
VKIAILNDTHFGARGDSQVFLNYFIKFFDEVFFPYLKEHNIKMIIHAGDFMDRRKFVNFNVLNHVHDRFISVLHDNDIKMHCILGNHDVYYRNTNRVNSLQELFRNDIIIYDEPQVVNFDGLDVAFLPWVNKENYDESVRFIKTANAPILIGHLELEGYQVMRGVDFKSVSGNGMDPSLFRRYEKVLSGHFHCRQERDNIQYLGTQYQITFSDLMEQKGFHILDTETREVEFVPNPFKMFVELNYNDEGGPLDLDKSDYTHLKDTYVRVVVEHKEHSYSFDRFIDRLYTVGVSKITIVEEGLDISDDDEELIDLAQDTVTLINNEVDGLEEVKNKNKMKKLIKDLYMESLSI